MMNLNIHRSQSLGGKVFSRILLKSGRDLTPIIDTYIRCKIPPRFMDIRCPPKAPEVLNADHVGTLHSYHI
jgi:hypothetical protein